MKRKYVFRHDIHVYNVEQLKWHLVLKNRNAVSSNFCTTRYSATLYIWNISKFGYFLTGDTTLLRYEDQSLQKTKTFWMWK